MKTEAFIAAILFAFAVLLSMSCRGPIGPQGPAGERGLPGLPGVDGTNGINAVIEMVDPCPSISAQHPELLLLSDGTFYAVYAQGQKIHLTQLFEGIDYSTTDGRNCHFRIVAGEVVAD